MNENNKPRNRKFTITLTEELAKELIFVSETYDKTKSQVMEEALSVYLDLWGAVNVIREARENGQTPLFEEKDIIDILKFDIYSIRNALDRLDLIPPKAGK